MSSKSKKKYSNIIPAWLSAKRDNQEGRFIQVGNSLLLSEKYQSLTPGARHLYLCMAMECGGRREFKFPLSAATKYGISSSTFRRHIAQLEAKEFITVLSMQSARKPNEYTFSLAWKGIRPAF